MADFSENQKEVAKTVSKLHKSFPFLPDFSGKQKEVPFSEKQKKENFSENQKKARGRGLDFWRFFLIFRKNRKILKFRKKCHFLKNRKKWRGSGSFWRIFLEIRKWRQKLKHFYLRNLEIWG